MVGDTAANATEPDASARFRMSFEQTIRCGPLIRVDFKVFRFGVDSDVFVGVLLNVDLRTDLPLKDLIRPLSTFGLFVGHGIVSDCN